MEKRFLIAEELNVFKTTPRSNSATTAPTRNPRYSKTIRGNPWSVEGSTVSAKNQRIWSVVRGKATDLIRGLWEIRSRMFRFALKNCGSRLSTGHPTDFHYFTRTSTDFHGRSLIFHVLCFMLNLSFCHRKQCIQTRNTILYRLKLSPENERICLKVQLLPIL